MAPSTPVINDASVWVLLLDSSLTPDGQVLAVGSSAFAQLKLMCQLRPFIEMSVLITVRHALLTSHWITVTRFMWDCL